MVGVGSDVREFKGGEKVCGVRNGGGYGEYWIVGESESLNIGEGVRFV